MPSNDLIDAWLRYKQHNEGRSEGTVMKYRGYLDRLVRFLERKGGDLLSATGKDLESFTGLHSHEEGLSPQSRRALVAAIRGFYAWAQKAGQLSTNPAAALPYPTAGKKLPVAMGLQNAEKLLMQPDIDTVIGVRDAAMLALLIGCGPRISGLVRLNESDLQWANVDGREWLIVRFTEKGKKQRLVPAPHEAKLLLQAYLGHPELEDIDRDLPDGDRVLFVSVRNRGVPPHEYHGERRRISARSVHDMMQRYGEQAGIPENQLHAHACRHLYGTEMAEEDIDVLQRQALLGHEDPRTTGIYTHLATRKLAKVVTRANPLGKIRTRVSDLVRELERRGS